MVSTLLSAGERDCCRAGHRALGGRGLAWRSFQGAGRSASPAAFRACVVTCLTDGQGRGAPGCARQELLLTPPHPPASRGSL